MSKNTDTDKNAGPENSAGAGNNESLGKSSSDWKGSLNLKLPKVNKQYKDRLFRFIFASHPQWTLKLYNAINKTAYTNFDELEFTTLENALFMSVRNDLSFLIADTMNFYEAQSTPNPNMPMRFLIYAAMVYNSYISSARINLSSAKQQKLPAPRLVCLYEGRENSSIEDETVLSLETAFNEGAVSDISVKVKMLNINQGHNGELLEACRPLRDYSQFIYETRNYIDSKKSDIMSDKEINSLMTEAIVDAIEKLPDGEVNSNSLPQL